MRTARLLILPILPLLAVSCRWHGMERPPLGGRGGGGATPDGSTSVEDARFAQKTVTSKSEPATLVAYDGTRCVVTAQKFRETVTGEKVWCVWQ